MSQRIEESGLQVAKPIHDLVNQSILPGTGVTAAVFWDGFAAILAEFGPKNKALLDKRDQLQSQIDSWHRANTSGFEFADYKRRLLLSCQADLTS